MLVVSSDIWGVLSYRNGNLVTLVEEEIRMKLEKEAELT